MRTIDINGNSLTIDQIYQVACKKAKVIINEETVEHIHENQLVLEELVNQGKFVYGVNTGVGDDADKKIQTDLNRMQKC